jgi:hypothetical protein
VVLRHPRLIFRELIIGKASSSVIKALTSIRDVMFAFSVHGFSQWPDIRIAFAKITRAPARLLQVRFVRLVSGGGDALHSLHGH